MKMLLAFVWLSVNFIKSAILSGVDTAKLILLMPKNLQSGLCTMPYQNLDGYPLVALGMMITLTPGTTLIDIDEDNQMLTLHLLDLNDEDAVIKQIQTEYIQHLSQFSPKNLNNPNNPNNSKQQEPSA